MRMILIIGLMGLILFSGQAWAQPVAKPLIDSKPGEALLFNLEEWFLTHPLKEGKMRGDQVFSSPRGTINLTTLKGFSVSRHIHMHIDELIYVYKGSGEMYVNGKWLPVKAGYLHVNPRGVTHSVRTKDEELWIIGILMPQKPAFDDRIMIDE